jgi:hypothetical protein
VESGRGAHGRGPPFHRPDGLQPRRGRSDHRSVRPS